MMSSQRMRILWLCNCPMSPADSVGTGSWLGALAKQVKQDDAVELGLIAPGGVHQVTRQDCDEISQWLVPRVELNREGLPPGSVIKGIVEACDEFNPDFLHVWGTENYWGLLTARGIIKRPALLEMQGVKGAIAQLFFGGLTFTERLRCLGIKEMLKRKTMASQKGTFESWRRFEEEMIRGHAWIDFHTLWTRAQVKAVNPSARLFKVERALRDAFHSAAPWKPSGSKTIFCTAAYPAPFKGLHVAIKALSVLRKRVPDAILEIAGSHHRPGLRLDGYMRWVLGLIAELKLQEYVHWLGPLSAPQIVARQQAAGAVLIPTFVESYCVALCEAMVMGVPTVVSYTGGTSYLGRDERTCLFFPTGDEAMCAYQLERLLTDSVLATRLSDAARAVAITRHDGQQIVSQQLRIYRTLLESAAVSKLEPAI